LSAIQLWLVEPLADEVARVVRRIADEPDVRAVAVLPDVHLAGDVCVGMAIATERRIFPAAVGGDIGCGMTALAFDCAADVVDGRTAPRLLEAIAAHVPTARHRRVIAPPLPEALDPSQLSDERLRAAARDEARLELGTIGGGNHFAELQRDVSDGRLWLLVHSGSRGLGPLIRDHHLARATPAARSGLAALDGEGDDGRAYLADHAWAIRWATANRDRIVDAVATALVEIVGARPLDETRFACVHNLVRREEHDGRALWVHRKGAMPAADGERGCVPGSMGSPSFHVEGRGVAAALASSAHGAGRALPRVAARRVISVAALERQMAGVFWDRRRAALLRDEAPAAYKDIGAVMRAQRDLVRIVRRLEPVLSWK